MVIFLIKMTYALTAPRFYTPLLHQDFIRPYCTEILHPKSQRSKGVCWTASRLILAIFRFSSSSLFSLKHFTTETSYHDNVCNNMLEAKLFIVIQIHSCDGRSEISKNGQKVMIRTQVILTSQCFKFSTIFSF